MYEAIDTSPDIFNHLTHLVASIGGQSGQDYAKLAGIKTSHIREIVTQMILDAPEMLALVGKEHRDLIQKVGRYAANSNVKTKPTLVIGLPSLPGDFESSKFLMNVGMVGNMRLGLGISTTGRGGSLFSVGFKFHNSNKVYQILRVDYHGQGNVDENRNGRRGAAHGHARLLGTLDGLGDHIQGVGRPTFHYHVPFCDFYGKL